MRAAPKLIMAVFLLLFFGIAAALWVDLSCIWATRGYIYRSLSAVPPAQAAMVLGASIRANGELSPVLKERADAALALYKAGKAQKILVTGDNSSLEYDEVYPVGKYLAAAGVPKQDIFLDYAGFDTYSSMYRARDVFKVRSLIVVTQRFHLPRALFIARALGLQAVGYDAAAPGEYYLDNSLREIPATMKAVFDVYTARVPKFVGLTFPISGDGSATWLSSSTQMVYFAHE